RLVVSYRLPVAKLASSLSGADLAVDKDGVVYAAPDLPTDLPTISLPYKAPPTLLTLAGNWQSQRLAQLAEDSRAFGPPGGVHIQVDDRGVVTLALTEGRVVLGSCDDLDRKLSV